MINNNFEVIGTTNSDVASFTDEDVQPNIVYFYQVKAVNMQDTSAYSNQVVVVTLMTANNEPSALPLIVYPNPVKNWLSIFFPKGAGAKYHFIMFEMATTKNIKSFTVEVNGQALQQKVDVSDIPKGAYLLQVTDGVRQRHVKLIKQ